MSWKKPEGRSIQSALCAVLLLVAASRATAAVGLHFQNNNFGFGPYSIAAEAPASAFGVAAGDWFEPGLASVLAPTVFNPTSGGSVTISYSSFPNYTWNAYGWSHANEAVNSGNPLNGEEVVLSAFIFGLSNAENGGNGDIPIVVTLSGLSSIAPAGYNVKLIASSEWNTALFTPAVVDDGLTNEMVDLTAGILPEHPQWNGGLHSTGSVADALNVFHGDTLTITLTGPNEYGDFETPTYGRTTLSGVLITPAVPEPASLALAGLAALGLVVARRRACRV